MAHSQRQQESNPWLTRRDAGVALTVGFVLIAGWLWYDWSRSQLALEEFVNGLLFLTAILVGVRCLDFVFGALASHFRFRRQVGQFDRRAVDLKNRLHDLEGE